MKNPAAPVREPHTKVPRLYPILDSAALERRGCSDWAAVGRAMVQGGAQILQFRHKGAWTRAVYEQARALADDCARVDCAFVVNDRADMAKLLGAGVHVGQDDLAPADCRTVLGNALGEQPIVGFSTHNAAQVEAAAAESVDYVAFGPVFPTLHKDNPDPVAGLALLASVRRGVSSKSLVAIGGITRERAHAVFAAGADSLALIGDLLPDEINPTTIRERMEEWQLLIRQ